MEFSPPRMKSPPDLSKYIEAPFKQSLRLDSPQRNDGDTERVFSQPNSRPKHRRNRSIFTSSNSNSVGREGEKMTQQVIETLEKASSERGQKVQVVDDFTEGIF